jgi:hypothetical protein
VPLKPVNHLLDLFQAELVSMRHDITEEHAAREVLEKEVTSLLVQLHRVQLQLHSNSEIPDSESIREKLVRTSQCGKVVLSNRDIRHAILVLSIYLLLHFLMSTSSELPDDCPRPS